jgi:hypothetical protein
VLIAQKVLTYITELVLLNVHSVPTKTIMSNQNLVTHVTLHVLTVLIPLTLVLLVLKVSSYTVLLA